MAEIANLSREATHKYTGYKVPRHRTHEERPEPRNMCNPIGKYMREVFLTHSNCYDNIHGYWRSDVAYTFGFILRVWGGQKPWALIRLVRYPLVDLVVPILLCGAFLGKGPEITQYHSHRTCDSLKSSFPRLCNASEELVGCFVLEEGCTTTKLRLVDVAVYLRDTYWTTYVGVLTRCGLHAERFLS